MVAALAAVPTHAQSPVRIYPDLESFNEATQNQATLFATTAQNVGLADELDAPPGVNDTQLGRSYTAGEGNSLTFRQQNTGLPFSFRFTALQDTPFLTFDDDEGEGNLPQFDDALSPGDIDNGEDDDWRVNLTDYTAPLRAFAFELRDSSATGLESLRLFNGQGEVIFSGSFLPQSFFGIVSEEPFVRIEYNEDAGGDDIAVANFRFLQVPVAPTAMDVYAATPVSTAQLPQQAAVVLEGADSTDDALRYTIIDGPANGTLSDPANGNATVLTGAIAGQTVTYRPDFNFAGTDQFIYAVSDGTGTSESKTATVSVFTSYRDSPRQLGDAIKGDATSGEAGHSVAISDDGETVAVGAPFRAGGAPQSGQVRVYRRDGNRWTQLGNDIDGEAIDDRTGWSVSLSADGQTLAVGSIRNGIGGTVRVYRWNGIAWTALGNAIGAEAADDLFGSSVSLSSDGQTVAVGAPRNDAAGDDAGHVSVYHWNGDFWTQLGGDIDGSVAQEHSGTAVSLASDGRTVAVGAPRAGGLAGLVRVYRWADSNWVQLGDAINGETSLDLSGTAVSLSSDGHTVAIGAPLNDGGNTDAGHVRIYRWDGGSWIPLGSDIDGDAFGEQFGAALALSANGHTVAIGAPRFGVFSGDLVGRARVYGWNGGSWVQVGSDIVGNETILGGEKLGFSLALASDGQTLAAGAPESTITIFEGEVRLYDLTSNVDEDDDSDGIVNGVDECDSTPSSEREQINTAGCSPSERDSDNDGVSDAEDAFPEDPAETTDSDGDGLGDNRERELGTLPDNPDTDGDGFSDFDEVDAESDPLSAAEVPAATGLNIILIKAAIDAGEP